MRQFTIGESAVHRQASFAWLALLAVSGHWRVVAGPGLTPTLARFRTHWNSGDFGAITMMLEHEGRQREPRWSLSDWRFVRK